MFGDRDARCRINNLLLLLFFKIVCIQVEMENMETKKHYTFKCGRWLSESEEDGSIFREMPAEGEDIKKPQPCK